MHCFFHMACLEVVQNTAAAKVVLLDLHHPHCRADWKLCQISKAEEQQRTERFREQFKSFDIVNAS